ncbi:polysaccharide deacetylase family protein [Desulforudis sp. 1088]|uniref:polysaccharide deacetylase family protein n=1 Tax=unclassified Candidatus Desulforudis TaxID=2635950 RepID=UPI003CE4EC69
MPTPTRRIGFLALLVLSALAVLLFSVPAFFSPPHVFAGAFPGVSRLPVVSLLDDVEAVPDVDPDATPAYYRDRVVVLMYHNIGGPPGRGTISPARFEADIRALRANGFNFISPEQMAAFLDGTAAVPPNAVLITFDDGYEGTYRYAYPTLAGNGAKAIVFVIAGYVGRPGYLTWDQLREMAGSGVFAVGGHTFDLHRRAPTGPGTSAPQTVAFVFDPAAGWKETFLQYKNRVRQDIALSNEVFSTHLGIRTPFFAYPYGAYTPYFIDILRENGYRYFFTVRHGVNVEGQNPLYLKRINAGRSDLSTDKLIKKIKKAGRSPLAGRSGPAAWFPAWVRDPDLGLGLSPVWASPAVNLGQASPDAPGD